MIISIKVLASHGILHTERIICKGSRRVRMARYGFRRVNSQNEACRKCGFGGHQYSPRNAPDMETSNTPILET